MRITGLATGLDMDQIIKDSMKPYRIKIQVQQQKKEIVEIKQQLYRDVLKDSQDLYNKYFDVSKQDSLLLSKNWGTTSFTSSNESAVTVTGGPSAVAGNYSVEVSSLAEKANVIYSAEDLKDSKSFDLEFDGKKITINNITDDEKANPKKLAERINKELASEKIDVEVKYSEFSKGLVFESKYTGSNIGNDDKKSNEIKINMVKVNPEEDGEDITKELSGVGKNASVKITNSRGEVQEYSGSDNSVTFDGITFKFSDTTLKTDGTHEVVKISGKTDASSTKDKLVSFVNDYNKIMESLNEQILKKPNKNYEPLTDEQKKEMSEEEIKLWEQKVKEGQLYRDSDLTRIANGLKGIMSSISPVLEQYGIKPVQDYSGTKNGTYTIDEAKLQEGLEKDPQALMDAFIGNKDSNESLSQDGAMNRMKDLLYKETITVTASLIKKVGLENSSTSANNELSKSIEKYNKKITDLEKDFARREQALYSKYARLEVMMNNYNSQQSYLMQQLG